MIIFTKFIGTLEHICNALGAHGISFSRFMGSMSIADRERAIREFEEQKQVLVSTEIGGEGRNLSRPLNDNVAALSNLLEAAAGRSGLAGIRSRGRLARPFTRVAGMLSDAQERYREKEADLLGRISRVEANVRKVLELSGANKLSELPDEIQGKVRELRLALLPYRRELRALRQTMREDVERLGWRLSVMNLTAGPLLVILLGLIARWWRRRSVARILG